MNFAHSTANLKSLRGFPEIASGPLSDRGHQFESHCCRQTVVELKIATKRGRYCPSEGRKYRICPSLKSAFKKHFEPKILGPSGVGFLQQKMDAYVYKIYVSCGADHPENYKIYHYILRLKSLFIA